MQFEAQTARTLHNEHLEVKAFLEKLETELQNHPFDQPPAADNNAFTNLLGDLIAVVEVELTVHFKFEENALFPLLNDAGASDMTELLVEEHEVILPLALDLCEVAKTFRRNGYSDSAWNEFRTHSLELIERLTGHIDKEEIGLVPMIDTLVEEEDDVLLSDSYIMMR